MNRHTVNASGHTATQQLPPSGLTGGTMRIPLLLSLAVDGDTLLASLTDHASVMLVGELTGLAKRLIGLELLWNSPVQGPEPSPSEIALQLQTFGAALFEGLVPARIGTYLSEAPPCAIQLRIDATLAIVPWEIIFDGVRHWTHYHQISRSVLGAPASPPPAPRALQATDKIRVLVSRLSPVHAVPDHYGQELCDLLMQMTGLEVDVFPVGSLREQRRGVANEPKSPKYDVIHLFGSPSRILQALRTGDHLSQIVSQAKVLVIDTTHKPDPSTSWAELGMQLAQQSIEYASVCWIQRPGSLRPQASEISVFYSALCDGAALGNWNHRWTHTRDTLQAAISVFGDASVTFVSPGPDRFDRIVRHATALSYDLAGSTRLMQQIGIEQYSLSLHQHHLRLRNIVSRWGGVSDQPQGDDGIMCYFGVQHVREDTVRSALCAAQKMMEEARRMDVDIRIGLATGQVAVNEEHVVGLSVHLAARIQALAPVGTILISETTAKLAQPSFVVEVFADRQVFKGFSGSARVYRLGPLKPPQFDETGELAESVRLHGRQAEMDRLNAIWAQTCQGLPRWLQVNGEAGIGKSRLVASFLSQLGRQGTTQTFICRCYAETSGRAFAPIIDMLERWFQIQTTDDMALRQSKLARGVLGQGVAPVDHLAVSYLMGLPVPDTCRSLVNEMQEPRRRFLMRTMPAWLLGQSSRQQLCFVVEDLQWADPSTLEFLHSLKREAKDEALLVLLTQRTSHADQMKHPLANESLQLGRLTSAAAREMITALASRLPISRQLVDSIEARSDGVPLFIEMSTRMVMESQPEGGSGTEKVSISDLPIPLTVRDLLMQRLDNLGTARSLAQLCSVIGREFPQQLFLAMCDANKAAMPTEGIPAQLATLLRSGLLLATGSTDAPDVQYYFRHALVHEVAYQSMWETDRRLLHRMIAQAIENRLPEIAESQPEVLAHHYEACGAWAQSAKWHRQAARKYKTAEAHAESMTHLALARHSLQKTPTTPERLKSELDIELTMAGQLIATKGYGSQSAGQSYLAALSFGQKLKDQKAVLRAQLGLVAYHLMRADFGQTHAYIAQAQITATEFDDALTRAQCLFSIANVLHHQGHARAMQELCDQCLAVCRASRFPNNLVQSPEVMSLMYSSVCLWETGQVDQARQRAQVGVETAERLGQRLGLGQALGMQAMVLLWCGDVDAAFDISERAISVCQAGDYDMWSAHARLIHGSCVCELGEPARGLAMMDAAYELWVSTGTVITRTFYLALRAQGHAALGQVDKGLELVDAACRIIKAHGEKYYEPEVLRVKGELLILKSTGESGEDAAAADAAFAEAQDSARELGYLSLALRIATSMARRQEQLGDKNAATHLVQSAFLPLKEGRDTRDQQVAADLLEQLMH